VDRDLAWGGVVCFVVTVVLSIVAHGLSAKPWAAA